MITLDDAIEQERKQAEMYRCEYECECDYYGKCFVDDHGDEFDCIKNMHEHEQIIEWFEELKVYQQHEIICNKGYNSGYNKAIDDAIDKISCCGKYNMSLVDELRKLKDGGENENYNKEES